MCGSHADSVYIIYFINHIRTGPLHTVTSGQTTVTPVRNARNQNTSKKLAHCYTQNTINSKHQESKQSIISTYHYLQLQKILPDRFPVMHSVQNKRTIDQITSMSKSTFWGTVTHVLVPIYILQAFSMKTGLNQLTMNSVPPLLFFSLSLFFRRLTREFASAKTNVTEKYGEDLEKMKLNGPGKRKLGQGTNYGTE